MLVSFTARVPVNDSRRAYVLTWREPGMPPGVSAETGTRADVAAGQTLTFTISGNPSRGGLLAGAIDGTVSLLAQTGAGGLEGPGSARVPAGSFTIRVP